MTHRRDSRRDGSEEPSRRRAQRPIGRACALATAAVLSLLAAAPAAPAAKTLNGFVGSPLGGHAGLYVGPQEAAVYDADTVSRADDKLFVLDRSAHRAQRLDRHGNPELAWGGDVIAPGAPGDTGTGAEICDVALSGAIGCKQGEAASGDGAFRNATGIAVNQGTGDVYVLDHFNGRVQQFDSDTNFIRSFGEGSIGVPSVNPFFAPRPSLAVSPLDGDVFVADPGNHRVLRFNLDGTPHAAEPSFGSATQFPAGPLKLAVDAAGILYASDDEADQVVRYDTATSTFLDPLPASLLGAGETKGLELDPGSGNLFVARLPEHPQSPFVSEISDPGAALSPEPAPNPTLADLHLFDTEEPWDAVSVTGLGYDPADDNIYLVMPNLRARPATGVAFTGCDTVGSPSPSCAGLVVLADTAAPLAATFPAPPDLEADPIVAEGNIDPGGGTARAVFELAKDDAPLDWQPASAERYATGTEPVQVSAPLGFSIDSLEPNAPYRLRMRAVKQVGMEDQEAVIPPDHIFTTPAIPPTVETISSSQRGITSARIYGRINPNNSPTEYWFEWGETTAYGNRVPVPDGDAGEDFEDHVFFEQLEGLEPDTTYHYRIVADNGVEQAPGDTEVKGADVTFTTRQAVPDLTARAFEMVTPPFKPVRAAVGFSAGVRNNPNVGVPSLDGETVAWQIPFFPLDDTVGAPLNNDRRLMRRTASGWINETQNTLSLLEDSPTLVRAATDGTSADFESATVEIFGGTASADPSAGALLPTEGPVANVYYTYRKGTGTQGYTPWLDNPSEQVIEIGATLGLTPDTYAGSGGHDTALFTDDGSTLLRWGHYGGLAESQSGGDEDPSDNQDLLGMMVYAQRAADPDQTPTALKDLVNECTGQGAAATLIPERDRAGTPFDPADDVVDAQPCVEGALVSPRGAVAGARAAATALSGDGRTVFFSAPDPHGVGVPGTTGVPSICTSATEADTNCPPQLFVRRYGSLDPADAVVRWISRSRSEPVPGEPGAFTGPMIAGQAISLMGPVRFEAASRDGSVVYFRTSSPLTPDDPNGAGVAPPPGDVIAGAASGASWDLYRYELPEEGDPDDGELTRISGGPTGAADPNTNPFGPGEGAALRFLSDDGTRAYFLTGSPLAGADSTPPSGGSTTPGTATAAEEGTTRNLYLFDSTKEGAERWRFLGRLPFFALNPGAGTGGGPGPQGGLDHCAAAGESIAFPLQPFVASLQATEGANCFRGTPDGSHVVFQTAGRLAADDTDPHGDVYVYDATADELIRVSAPPEGGAPSPYPCNDDIDATVTPGRGCNGDLGFGQQLFWGSFPLDTARGFAGMRHYNLATNPDGTVSVFFQSRTALVPEDTNSGPSTGDYWDTYEWRAGELSLISRGDQAHDSWFSGNSLDGEDVFIWTSDRIDPRELDPEDFDLYDARRRGGFPYTPPPGPCDVLGLQCEGEAVDSAFVEPPGGSDRFAGAGNLRPSPTRPNRCARLARNAQRTARNAKRFRRAAKRAEGRRARKLAQRARKAAGNARRTSRAAKRCRRRARGKGKANKPRRADRNRRASK